MNYYTKTQPMQSTSQLTESVLNDILLSSTIESWAVYQNRFYFRAGGQDFVLFRFNNQWVASDGESMTVIGKTTVQIRIFDRLHFHNKMSFFKWFTQARYIANDDYSKSYYKLPQYWRMA